MLMNEGLLNGAKRVEEPPLNLNKAVDLAARKRKDHKKKQIGPKLLLIVPTLAVNVLDVADFMDRVFFVFFAFFCGHSICFFQVERLRQNPTGSETGKTIVAALNEWEHEKKCAFSLVLRMERGP
jgi:hypothetical protein